MVLLKLIKMRTKKIKSKKENKDYLWLVLAIIGLIMILVFREGLFGKTSLVGAIYGLLVMFLIIVYIHLEKILRENYYTPIAYPMGIARGRISTGISVLISPGEYFKKENFWKAYFLYIISKITILVAVYSIIKFIISLI